MTALTIAGSDPSGGAGLQADLKIFQQFRLHGMSVVTLLTVQNTVGVKAVEVLKPDFVLAQLDAVLEDIPPDAAKTGALGSAELISAIANRAKTFAFPLVVDPVMISKHGDRLIDDDAVEVLRDELIPQALIVTPNRREAERLSGLKIDDLDSASEAALTMIDRGAQHVLLKCGPLPYLPVEGESSSNGSVTHPEFEQVSLFASREQLVEIRLPHLDTDQLHGSGCVLSAAITAGLANDHELLAAVEFASTYVHQAISLAPGLGKGVGPTEMRIDIEDQRDRDEQRGQNEPDDLV